MTLLHQRGRAARTLVGLALLAVALPACGGGDTPTPAVTHDPRGAYELLSACPVQPSPPALEPVAGLHLPPEPMIFSQTRLGPLTQVEGFIDLTPIEVRAHYEGRDDLEILQIEDEGFETEALVSDGTHRMYVKARVLCRTGSNLTATVGRESQAAALPTPAAGQSPPPR